jgi:hypothetical protein
LVSVPVPQPVQQKQPQPQPAAPPAQAAKPPKQTVDDLFVPMSAPPVMLLPHSAKPKQPKQEEATPTQMGRGDRPIRFSGDDDLYQYSNLLNEWINLSTLLRESAMRGSRVPAYLVDRARWLRAKIFFDRQGRPIRFTPAAPAAPHEPHVPHEPSATATPHEPSVPHEPNHEGRAASPTVCPDCHSEVDSFPDRPAGVTGCEHCLTQCADCELWHDPSDVHENVRMHYNQRNWPGVTNGSGTSYRSRRLYAPICNECTEGGSSNTDYFQCADCNEHFNTELNSGNNANDEPICETCGEDYFTCDSCGNVCHNDDYGQEGECQSCWDEDHSNCRDCGDDVHNDDLNEDGYCDSCAPDHSDSALIRPRHKGPGFHPMGEGRHYGTELETVLKEGGKDLEDTAQETLDKLGDDFVHLEEDGSLSGGIGQFEIVSQPATLDIHRKRWDDFLSNPPKKLVSHNAPCDCGLHIHIEKEGMSPTEIGRMVTFFNHPDNRDFMVKMARRYSERWAKINPDTRAADIRTRKIRPGDKGGDRYVALNLTPKKTVEIRMFKGTLNKESFFRSLEFADAMTDFCQANRIASMKGIAPFLQFVTDREATWPILAKFCTQYAADNNHALTKREAPPLEPVDRMNRRGTNLQCVLQLPSQRAQLFQPNT